MKLGYEIELLAPLGQTRESIAESFAKKFQLNMKACFHRESEHLPGIQDLAPYYCLTKGFELYNSSGWQLRFINDMTIRESIDKSAPDLPQWFHILTDDIRFIDLILCHCDPTSKVDQILLPIAKIYNSQINNADGIYSVSGNASKLICAAHSQMTDRNRICEIVTSPITDGHHLKLEEIIEQALSIGCIVPKEAAFHIHFDGLAFANTTSLLRLIRYFYIWSDVLKKIIPPNPNCTRLGDYNSQIIDYAFNPLNEKKVFEQTVSDLKQLSPTKYCDFNFNNILIGNPDKFTIEVRAIPMILNAAAMNAASDLYISFINFISTSDFTYSPLKKEPTSENVTELLQLL